MLHLGLAPSFEWAYFVNYAFLLLETWLFFRPPEVPRVYLEILRGTCIYSQARKEPSFFGRPTSLTKGSSRREGKNQEARPAEEEVGWNLPILGWILAADQGFLGTFRVGQTKHFKVKQVFLGLCAPFQLPWVFLLNRCFSKREGVGVENKGSSSWQTVAIGEKGVSGAVFARALGILKGHLVYSFPE